MRLFKCAVRTTLLAWLGLLAVTGPVRADMIKVLGGDILRAEILEQTEETIVIEHPALGRVVLSRDKVLTIVEEKEPDQVVTEVTPGAAAAAPTQPDAGSVRSASAGADSAAAVTATEEGAAEEEQKKTGWRAELDHWDATLDISWNSASGNTEETSLRLGWTALRRTELSRLSWDLTYYWKASDGSTTDNKLSTGVRYTWLMPESPWFWFVQARFDWDEFESWEQRIAAHGGPGYHLIKNDKVTLDLLGGIGVRKEFGSTNDDPRLEGLLGLDFTYKLTGRQTIELDAYLYPVLHDFSDYRIRSGGRWRYLLDEKTRLSLLLGYTFEYQSVVDDGSKNEDLRIFAGIQLAF